MQPAAQLFAYGLFFFSGATALVYQVVWLRDLSLIFGASFHATSIVLASFMGGLAIGGFVAGRYSESLRRPLRVYGLLENRHRRLCLGASLPPARSRPRLRERCA